jgi:AraC-like DNA-binding protein
VQQQVGHRQHGAFLDRAVYLLTHSRDPIKKIGFQLRYSEPSNLVHAFSRCSGVSPTQFRNAALKIR